MKPKCLKFALLATLSIFGAPSDFAEAHAKTSGSALELLVLGSGGPRSFGRACTSYVVLIQGKARILIDAGPGAFLEAGKLGIDLANLDIVLLTHLHIDHSGDIPALFLDRALAADRAIHFRVFGPQGRGLFPSTTQFLAPTRRSTVPTCRSLWILPKRKLSLTENCG